MASPAESGHDMHFTVETEKYHCPVCLLVLREAVQTSCGHRFCQACIDRVIGQKSILICPVDKQISRRNQIFPDVAIRREVLSLLIRCSNAEDGCDWTGELREHKNHVENCPTATVSCPQGCDLSDMRCHMEAHLQTCPMREITCTFCCDKIVWQGVDTHLAECSKFPVKCEVCKATDILREDLKKHTDIKTGSCPEIHVHCKFKDVGCDFFDKRSSLALHMADSTATAVHTKLLFEHATERWKENSDMRNLIIQLQSKLESVEKRVEDTMRAKEQLDREISLRNVTGQLHWKVDVRGLNRSPSGVYHSQAFYTGCPGYKVQIDLDIDSAREGSVRFSGIGLTLLRGEYDDQLMWPFNATCYVTLLDQMNAVSRHKNRTSNLVLREVPRNRHNNSYDRIYKRSMNKFIKRQELIGPQSRFLKQGSLFLEVSVVHCCYPPPEVSNSPIANLTPVSLHAVQDVHNSSSSPVLNLASLSLIPN